MSRKVYLDNAATTAIDERVLEAMLPFFRENYGNPSSIHGHGRLVRSAIEKSRKTVADILNVSPAEIIFTSGGTEAHNTFLCSAVKNYGITDLISTKIEHHAVLHTLQGLQSEKVKLHQLDLDDFGMPDLSQLEMLLQSGKKSMVSLMHGNNEIGNLLSIDQVAAICDTYKAIFHSDTVQTIGHYPINLQELPAAAVAASAHKFHGPKGIGFLYTRNPAELSPYVVGGSQERNMRGGTENVAGIIGLSTALQLAIEEMETTRKHCLSLKEKMVVQLSKLEGFHFYGHSADQDKSLYTVLSVSLPPSDVNEMLLFNLDIKGISASGGSACTSGSNVGSHVINELETDENRAVVRFSFSKYTTQDDIDYTCAVLKELYAG